MRSLLLLLVLGWFPLTDQHVISIAQGRLRGERHDAYVSYRGVPYATAASPDGRFKRAGLAPLWPGIREPREVQCSATSSVEQCLQLDAHVPDGAGPWPVLAWLAAGGAPRAATLVREGIILVVVYHRIGPQGFLCLEEDKVPGNAGVKDTVLALRWIRDNIVAFKGDAAKVVMAGQGFGAAVAEAIMLSPMASGLYHGVIMQSGTVLAPWAFNYDAKKRATKLREMISQTDDMPVDTLLNTKIEELVDKSNMMDMPYFPFGICKENEMKHEERLLSVAPLDLLSSKRISKVPIILGYNSDEAYIFSSILMEAEFTKLMSRPMTFLLPEELKFLNEREINQVARQVEDMYFKSNRSLRAVLDYHRDAYFVNHIHRSARLHASTHPVYYYQFSYSGDRGVREELGIQKKGAAHSDELAFLFSGRHLNNDDGTVQKHLVKLWTNFVKYLNATYKESTRWDAMDSDHARLLDIGTELNMIDFPHSRATDIWDDIYDKYYYSKNRVT